MTKEDSNTLVKDLMDELIIMRQIIHNIENREFIHYIDKESIPVETIDYSIDFDKKTLIESYDRNKVGKFQSLKQRYEKQITK